MLKTIHVRNMGVLEDVEVDFPRGLSCLTGETGAGKSLLVGAIKLLLGGRADAGDIRHGEASAYVDAVFDVTGLDVICDVFDSAGYEIDDGEVHLRRQIAADGRGRAWIQGQPATVRQLRELGEHMISVAGQHAFIGLSLASERLSMLDAFAQTGALRDGFAGLYRDYLGVRGELDDLLLRVAEREVRRDYLGFVVQTLESAEVRDGELEQLDREAVVLRQAVKLKDLAARNADGLYDGNSAVYDALSKVNADLRDMAAIDRRVELLAERLESALIEVREVARELTDYGEALDLDPARSEVVENRRELLRDLIRKYGGSEAGVVQALGAARTELQALDKVDEQSHVLEARLGEIERQVKVQAAVLSGKRRSAAGEMSRMVTEAVRGLDMGGATLRVEVVDGELSETGGDRIDFMIETNRGEGFGPVADVASGGELSRITLSLYSVLSASVGTPVMVYDEIDAGVSGAVAERMADVLASAAEKRQILVVTHHGQVAAKATAHYAVDKKTADGRTIATVVKLEGEDRLKEIARIIGGQVITRTVRDHARELLGGGERDGQVELL